MYPRNRLCVREHNSRPHTWKGVRQRQGNKRPWVGRGRLWEHQVSLLLPPSHGRAGPLRKRGDLSVSLCPEVTLSSSLGTLNRLAESRDLLRLDEKSCRQRREPTRERGSVMFSHEPGP